MCLYISLLLALLLFVPGNSVATTVHGDVLAPAVVYGHVYIDSNLDGVWNNDEMAAVGAMVEIHKTSYDHASVDTLLAYTRTNNLGDFVIPLRDISNGYYVAFAYMGLPTSRQYRLTFNDFQSTGNELGLRVRLTEYYYFPVVMNGTRL